ncbi:beta-glucosidase BglX [Zunongwangia profunda]|nr:beta-glucosidase BglX [Zunongwangia profunda]MAG86920.1 beta-glucosidase BglX [Flavobacteriaceae bacterium]MAS70496.1 beta-glucosidase BglX [Zunongwangia sp.]|tara:strand:- start:3457 stop:5751 length:2295 start_codon:yes stop_codon:yes gene_type:complete
MKKRVAIIGVLLSLGFLAFSTYEKPGFKKSDQDPRDIEQKIDSVLALMTLDEKIGQMVQYNGSWDVTGPATGTDNEKKLENLKNGLVGSMLNVTSVEHTREAQKIVMENSRLKIPLIFGYDVIHGYQTMFPVPLGESASWDLELMEKTARVAGRETAAAGVHWTFAPMMDISRDARWGRIMEGAGEDPYLNSKIAVARIKGFQGNDLSDPKTIAACAKHFAGYGFAEGGRDYNTVNIGIYELNNTILPPFKAAADAGVATFMNSFNEIDGVPATASTYLQRDLLKGKWHWDGFVVSDWGSITELIPHGVAKDKKAAAELAVKAGSDMDMEGGAYESSLKELVEEGKVAEKLIDDAVKRILRVKFRLGLFDDPYKYCDEAFEKSELYSEANQKVALEAGKKSIVLLKNENDILPIKNSIKNIAVIGPLANDKDSPLGNWRAHAVENSAVSVLEGIRNYAPKGVKITYAEGAKLSTGDRSFLNPMTFNKDDKRGFAEAEKLAKQADLVVLVVGEDAFQTGEGRSQTNIGFAGVQDDLIETVQKANKNVVMVLMNGRPMDLSWSSKNIPAIVESWFLGSQHGNAVAEILFGKYNPSGKLPVSFPQNSGMEPLYYNQKSTGRPEGGAQVTYSHYTDSPREALYPFGFGLSFTEFEYGDIELSADSFSEGEKIEASISVKNTGNMVGEETVQLYLHDLVGSITRPNLELKAFEKISLKPGERKVVNFIIDKEMITYFTINKKWEAEAGDFEVMIGGNSVDLKKANFEFK